MCKPTNINLLVGIILIGAALLIYFPTLKYEFVFDDEIVIAGNRMIRDISRVPVFLKESTYSFFRPIRSISYLLDYYFWLLNPVGFHLTNILIHGLCAFSFYLILKKLGNNIWTGLVAALIFSVHPANTEAVIYLSSRAELLGTFFTLIYLLSALLYLKANKIHHLIVSLFLLALALLSKESFAIAPLFILIILSPLKSTSGYILIHELKRRRRVFYFSLLLTGLFLVYRFFIISVTTDLGQFKRLLTYPQILIKIPSVILTYFRIIFLPINSSPHHPLDVIPLPSPAGFIGQFSVLIAIIILLLLWGKAGRLTFRGVLWILIALIPVSQIYPLPRLFAEKYLYFPSLGFALLFASFVNEKNQDRKFRRIYFPATIILIYMILTLVRQPVWKSNYSLWEKTSKNTPASPLTLYNWGMAQIKAGDFENGLETLKTADFLLPGQSIIREGIADDYFMIGQYDKAIDIYLNLLTRPINSPIVTLKTGLAYEYQGYPRLAKRFYEAALNRAGGGDTIDARQLLAGYRELSRLKETREKPLPAVFFLEALLKLFPRDPGINYRLGQAYELEQRYEEALACYSRALEQTDAEAELLYRQGQAYQGSQQFKKAMQSYHRALKHNPNYYPAYFELGGLLAGYGEYTAAERFYRAGLKLSPNDHRAHTNLGSILQFQKNYLEAIIQYETSIRITDSFKAHYNLGFLYLNKLNNPKKALPHLKKALHQATDPAHKKKLEETLNTYKTE